MISPSWVRARRTTCQACWIANKDDNCELTAEEIDAMVAEQLPTMPTGGPGEAPRPLPREGRGTLADRRVERTWREWDVPPAWSLHPDTAPDAIAATHQELVEQAVRELGPDATAERISEAVCLPVWNVKRILEGTT